MNTTTIIDPKEQSFDSANTDDSCSNFIIREICFDKIKCGWCEQN